MQMTCQVVALRRQNYQTNPFICRDLNDQANKVQSLTTPLERKGGFLRRQDREETKKPFRRRAFFRAK
jgi:hypothetical protein